jgi:hypothetical protein
VIAESDTAKTIEEAAPISLSRKRLYAVISIQLLLFTLTTGLLAVLAEQQSWKWFSLTLLVATSIYFGLQVLESQPMLDYFKTWEKHEFHFSRRVREFGVLKIYNMQEHDQQDERNADTRATISDAVMMNLMAHSAASYIDPALERHWSMVSRKLRADTPFNIIILDPFSPDKRVRDELNIGGEAVDSKLRLDLLARLHNEYPNVRIRVSPRNIYCTLFFTENAMYFDPYHLAVDGGRITNRFICMKLTQKEMTAGLLSHYELLKRHFSTVWDHSSKLEDFWERNEVHIRRRWPSAPTLQRRDDS